MEFKIDENLPIEAKQLLQEAGHDAALVRDQQLEGKPDSDIVLVCQRENRVLITLDMDFADIRAYPPSQHAGIVVLRLKHGDKVSVLSSLSHLIPMLSAEPVRGHLWIVEKRRVRIRD
jgi:predicted nuclease of predicted toxin-antitoxin system